MLRARWRFLAISVFSFTLALVAGRSAAAQGTQGTITGRVTDASSQLAVPEVRLLVIGTNLGATAGSDGRFTIRNVAAGRVEVQALRVGYRTQKQVVTVAPGASATADFKMEQAALQLDEIVTTATGQQRKIELGNSIATLGDVSKRVEQSSTHSMADLLVAKSPGVILLPSPVVGGAPTIRVRGISSISLTNAPIWYVDGVRYSTNNTSSAGANANTLLNNLSPEEIEDIEIVKGPSAATLYGTNAANGVILITTKKGRAGNARWTWTAESRTISDRNKYQAQYANWGHSPTNLTTPVRCQLSTMQTAAFTVAQGATCISDSLTSYNLLGDPANTIIHLGRGSLYGMNVSGGTEAVRYYAGVDLDNEYGPIQMPAQDIRFYDDSLHTSVSNSMLHPRQGQKANFRTNLSAALSPKVDLTVSAGFGKSSNIVEPDNSAIIGLLYTGQANFGFKGMGACPIVNNVGCLGKPFLDPTGFPLHDYNLFAPGSVMQYVTTNDVQRFTGSANVTWRPLSWMQNDGTMGVDWANNDQFHVCRLNECPNSGATSRVGNAFDFKENRRNFSAKLSSTGSWQPRSWANLKTSVGADYTNVSFDNENAQGRTLAPGASTLGATATAVAWSATNPTAVKTLGYYAQEQIGLRDRLFITVAARSDQNSAFGSKFQRVLYPKVSLSWIASDESFFPKFGWMSSFRVRSAYGANGVQPGATSALQTFSTTTVTVTKVDATTGTDVAGLAANNPGNANLKPETSAEFEGGIDTDLLNHRLHFEWTYYNKKTSDALISVPIPASVGASTTSLLQNIGSTQNWGNEFQATGVLFDRSNFGWDVTVSASHNNNKWVELGIDPGTGKERIIGAGGTVQHRQGDPLYSQWYRNFTYDDANHDGVIQVAEVKVDSGLTNHGVGFAKDLVSVQSGFDLLKRRLRINMLFDYKGGGNTLEGNYFQCPSTPRACRETQDPSAPLWIQARAVAVTSGTRIGGTTYTTRLGYFVSNQFWKFRELSAVISLPDRVARLARAQNSSSFVVGLRNIRTWSSFTGVDPEQNYGVSGSEVNNDFNTSPPPTYLTLRLNLKY